MDDAVAERPPARRSEAAVRLRTLGWLRGDTGVALLFALLVGAYFWKIVTGGYLLASDILYAFDPWRELAPPGFRPNNPNLGDTVDAMYPNVALLARGWLSGDMPLWNPYTAGGVPLGTLITSGALYPLNALYTVLPVEAALGPHALFRVIIAAWFTYRFLRAVSLDPGPAVLGAVVFAFSGWQIAWLGWPHTYVSVWLPALLWAVERYWQSGRPAYASAAGAAAALLLLGGFPSVAAYALALTGYWAAWRLVVDLYPVRRLAARAVAVRIGWLAGALALGLLAGSAQLPTTTENFRETGYEAWRAAERAYYAGYHLPAPMAISLLVPRYFGDGAAQPFWGAANFVETTGYVGLLPPLLAPLALAGRHRRLGVATAFAIVAAGSLMLVYGVGPLLAVASRLPVLNSSASTRTLLCLDFALAVLGAIGAQRLLDAELPRRRALALVAAVGLGLAGFVVTVDRFWATLPDSNTYLAAAAGLLERTALEPPHTIAGLLAGDGVQGPAVAAFGLSLTLAGAAALLGSSRRGPRWLRVTPIVAAATFDLWLFGGSINTVLRPEELPPEPPTFARLRAESAVEPFRVLNLGTTLLANVPSVAGVSDVGGHVTAQPARYTELLRSLDPSVDDRRRHGTRLVFGPDTAFDSPLLDLLGVRYVVGPPGGCERVGKPIAEQRRSDAPVRPLEDGHRAVQRFVADGNGLDTVCVTVGTYGGAARGRMVFTLWDESAATEIARSEVDVGRIADNADVAFRFAPQTNSDGRHYAFAVESPGAAAGAAATVWRSSVDAYAAGEAEVDGTPLDGDLRFRAVAVEAAPDATLWTNRTALPRAFLARAVERVEPAQAVARVTSSEFDPGRLAVVEEPVRCLPSGAGVDARVDAGARLTAWRPGVARIETDAPTCGVLVFTESFYPGWRASVDGAEAAVLRVDAAFVGVPLEAGAHRVELRFTAPAFDRGLWITVAAVLALALLALVPATVARNMVQRKAGGG